MGLLNKFLKSYSEKEIKKTILIIKKIDNMDADMQILSDEELKNKTFEFKSRLQNGETLDDILPEAFAVVRESSFRVLGLKHFKEQLIGGIILHQGRIAEMKTGEGKTLVATLPVYLNALEGKGVHVVTVNDYLAKRDSDDMGQIYTFLGLTVGVIVNGLSQHQRKEAYNCDITYGTNSEFGFDYLRDNMATTKDEIVQRVLNFAIVDEVDSILIDEARTPLIISGHGEQCTPLYKIVDCFVKALKNEVDYKITEKTNSIILTDIGVAKAEKYFNLENYADSHNIEIQHYLIQALKGNYMMKKDINYIVKDGNILIIDEFTGRMIEGRKYSEGLHQAIEAKENVVINTESKTLATITLQNYFRIYTKLSGMSGTALGEQTEFRETYGLDVIVIPTHKPILRIDNEDIIYKTEKGKFNAVVKEIIETHKTGQPVLIGTASIEKSELLSELLKEKGMPHQVLNAKHHAIEAEIISRAGEKNMVTIATNMAGRGTDIKLSEELTATQGLKIIGTERNESRRIDDQLRGRSGRQGNLGESRFYISLEDDLMRKFGSDKLEGVVKKLDIEEDTAIESKMISNAIKNAQKKVEGNNFETRKELLKYDGVMTQQREIIYNQRLKVLQGEDLSDEIQHMIKEFIFTTVDLYLSGNEESLKNDLNKLINYLEGIFITKGKFTVEGFKSLSNNEIKENLHDHAMTQFKEKELLIGSNQMRVIERIVLLRVVDEKWKEHLNDMEHLKQGIGLRAYNQKDPAQAYQMEGSEIFEEMIYNIKMNTIKHLYHIQVEKI